MQFIDRVQRVAKKVLRGEGIAAVRLTKEQWDRQYAKGKWDYLMAGEPNLATTVAVCGMLATKRAADDPLSVLDVGCGNGAIPLGLSMTNVPCDYYGTDISQTALDAAKDCAPTGTYVRIDMEEGAGTDRTFDVVIFSEVLLYADWKKTFDAHRRNMRPDTIIVISLYRTLRTWFIWRHFLPLLSLMYEFRVHDARKHNRWDIRVGTVRR